MYCGWQSYNPYWYPYNPYPYSRYPSCNWNWSCPPRPAEYMLSGVVFGVSGAPASGITVSYTVGGITRTTVTDAFGQYTIRAPECSTVVIAVTPDLGVTATPPLITVNNVCGDRSGLNFYLSAVTPAQVTLSGTVTGAGGAPAANQTVAFTINGQSSQTTTNALGSYSIAVPKGANVTIAVTPGVGVTVTPANYTLANVQASMSSLNFILTVV